MENSYSYMNEDAIDDELKCAVCHQPFREPVSSIQCHHTFCKECITTCLNQERRCPVCRVQSDHEDYQSVKSRPLLNQLNRLHVRCTNCQARNIQRSDFHAHAQKCPNWVIPCTAADIQCTWQGMRNQLANHVKNCPFQQVRPILDHFHGQITHLQDQIRVHSKRIDDLQEQTQSQGNKINGLQNNLEFFPFILFILVIGFFALLSSSEQSRQPRSFGEKFRGLFQN